MLNSICGLGKEPASKDSISFVSYAYYHGYIDKLIYSFELAPSLAEQSATNLMRILKEDTEVKIDEGTIVNKVHYKYETELQSTFVMGGYDEDYMTTKLTWFDTSQCEGGWNVTASSMTLSSGESVMAESFTVQPQVAYPFIAIPESAFEIIRNKISAINTDKSK